MESDLVTEAARLFDEQLLPQLGAAQNVYPRRGGRSPLPATKKLLDALEEAELIDISPGGPLRLGRMGKLVNMGQKTTREVLEKAFPTEPSIFSTAEAWFNQELRPRYERRLDQHLCLNSLPPEEALAQRVLAQARILTFIDGGPQFKLGPIGELVLAEMKTVRQALVDWHRNATASTGTTNNFSCPVGAVAAAPGSTAHGTITINQVDQSLHRLVDLQDQLGEVTNDLWNILRRVRELELKETTDLETIKVDVLELELESFANRVKPEMHEHVVELLKCVPGLAKALLGGLV